MRPNNGQTDEALNLDLSECGQMAAKSGQPTPQNYLKNVLTPLVLQGIPEAYRIHDFGFREENRPPTPDHMIGFSVPAEEHSIVNSLVEQAHITVIELSPSQLIEHERLHERFQKLSAPFSGGDEDV